MVAGERSMRSDPWGRLCSLKPLGRPASMRKRVPSERKFSERSPGFQRDMHVISLPVWCSENRPKAGITPAGHICTDPDRKGYEEILISFPPGD